MSALIKTKILRLGGNYDIREIQNITLVIPFIKSFSDITENKYMIYECIFNELYDVKNTEYTVSPDQLCGSTYYTITCYTIEYKDTTSNEIKSLVFEKYKDAEKFLSELKSCINEFYNNADAYIKFVN